MTLDQYFDHLLKLGMGWLGWTEAETLDTSMPSITLAYDGRIELLQAVFGKGEPKEAEAAPEAAPDDDQSLPIADRLKRAFRALKGKR